MSDASPRFAHYEVVVVCTTSKTLADGIAGKTGAVMGISHPETEGGPVLYAVGAYDFDETCMVAEHELESTGRVDRREDFYSGESIRVSQEGELRDE